MSCSPHTTSSGYLLPSIHSAPPFFTQQPNPGNLAKFTTYWTRIIITYARHKRLFVLRIEDVETTGGDWDPILRNKRINRKVLPSHLVHLMSSMVAEGTAAYDPPKQTSAVFVYWRSPEEWAEVLHEWAISTGQLNTILTFYDIIEPPITSELTGIPITLLRKAITILGKTNRAQIIAVADGEGVRFFAASGK